MTEGGARNTRKRRRDEMGMERSGARRGESGGMDDDGARRSGKGAGDSEMEAADGGEKGRVGPGERDASNHELCGGLRPRPRTRRKRVA